MVSFNIRAGLSSSLDRIGDMLEQVDADIIALQEVDMGVDRTEGVRQAEVLAQRLGHQFAFASAIERGGGEYGVALLSRLPFARTSRLELRASGSFEPRVAVDADLCVGEKALRVLSVHSDIFPWSCMANARTVASAISGTTGSGVLVAGDLNATPQDGPASVLRQTGLTDVVGRFAEGPTFLGSDRRLDYVFADYPLTPWSAERVQVELSDHLPVIAELWLPDDSR